LFNFNEHALFLLFPFRLYYFSHLLIIGLGAVLGDVPKCLGGGISPSGQNIRNGVILSRDVSYCEVKF
jgi:hypothetical protein